VPCASSPTTPASCSTSASPARPSDAPPGGGLSRRVAADRNPGCRPFVLGAHKENPIRADSANPEPHPGRWRGPAARPAPEAPVPLRSPSPLGEEAVPWWTRRIRVGARVIIMTLHGGFPRRVRAAFPASLSAAKRSCFRWTLLGPTP
jgi:hypothetical protein